MILWMHAAIPSYNVNRVRTCTTMRKGESRGQRQIFRHGLRRGREPAMARAEWKVDESLPAGKGATVQAFVATVGTDKLEMNVAPWGEGRLKLNGREVAHIDHAVDRRHAFNELNRIASHLLGGQMLESAQVKRGPRVPKVKALLLEGKK